MLNPLQEIRAMHAEGKIHRKLLIRTRIMFGVALVLLCFTAYNLTLHPEIAIGAIALGALGFVLGLYIFSRMNVVSWDEQAEEVSAGRMDILGFATIGLYIVFEISLRTFLKDFYPASATALLLAGIFGTILGRAIGTVVEIHQAYRLSHK